MRSAPGAVHDAALPICQAIRGFVTQAPLAPIRMLKKQVYLHGFGQELTLGCFTDPLGQPSRINGWHGVMRNKEFVKVGMCWDHSLLQP